MSADSVKAKRDETQISRNFVLKNENYFREILDDITNLESLLIPITILTYLLSIESH